MQIRTLFLIIGLGLALGLSAQTGSLQELAKDNLEAGITGGDQAESNYYVLKAENQLYFKQYKDAYKLAKKALKLDDNNRDALVLAGDILYAMDKSSKALSYYNKAMAMGIEDPRLLYKIANTNLQYGNYTEAIETLGKAIMLEPENQDLYMLRGQAKMALQLYSEALRDYDKVLEIDPGMARAYANRGFCLMQLGNYQKALENLNKALTITPNDAEMLYQRGLTYIKAYNIGKGCDDLRSAKARGYEPAEKAIKENCQ